MPEPTMPVAAEGGRGGASPCASEGTCGGSGGGSVDVVPAEICGDGVDNDDNGAIDCEDAACREACGSSCDAVETPGLPLGTVEQHWTGNTQGAPDDLDASCGGFQVIASERVYLVEPEVSGSLSVDLISSASLAVSLRSSCDGGGLSACSSDSVSMSVEAGEPVYLIVDGARPGAAGPFELTLRIEAGGVCGDAHVDAGEECDDGGTSSSDGCDAGCNLENEEKSDNDSPEEAESLGWDIPFFGRIDSSSDSDYFRISVQEEQSLRVLVDDAALAGCSVQEPGRNPAVELLDVLGDPVGWDEDGGQGDCAELSLNELSAGDYWLHVYGQETGSFPYRVLVTSPAVSDDD